MDASRHIKMVRRRKIVASNRVQKRYSYVLTEPEGRRFHPDFRPELTPKQMLRLGVFGGQYMDPEEWKEFPPDWLKGARLSQSGEKDGTLNFFGVRASQPWEVWKKKGWLSKEDPYGWFQWYCRYYRGRRCPDDERQIRRWKAMKRHAAQVRKNCSKGDLECRKRQRQALMHWAYDSRTL